MASIPSAPFASSTYCKPSAIMLRILRFLPAPCSGGSDWQKILLLEVNQNGSTTQLNDTLDNVKFSTTAWAPDSKVSCPRKVPMQQHCCSLRLAFRRSCTPACNMGEMPSANTWVCRKILRNADSQSSTGAWCKQGKRHVGGTRWPGSCRELLTEVKLHRAGVLLQPVPRAQHHGFWAGRAEHGRQREPAAVVPRGGNAPGSGHLCHGPSRAAHLVHLSRLHR